MTDTLKVSHGQVVSMQYLLYVDGELMDSSTESEPLQFIQGLGQILPGLENELYDMQVGGQKRINLAAKDGYGELEPEAFMDVPREAFPSGVPLETGTELELQHKSGHPTYARIEGISDDHVRLNMNHPLAGKILNFDVTILSLREATNEELEHGHAHTHNEDRFHD